MERLREVAAGSVDLVFADPPFNIGYEYDDQQTSGEYLDWSKQWITGVHKALAADGTFWLAIGDEYAAGLRIAWSPHVAAGALQDGQIFINIGGGAGMLAHGRRRVTDRFSLQPRESSRCVFRLLCPDSY